MRAPLSIGQKIIRLCHFLDPGAHGCLHPEALGNAAADHLPLAARGSGSTTSTVVVLLLPSYYPGCPRVSFPSGALQRARSPSGDRDQDLRVLPVTHYLSTARHRAVISSIANACRRVRFRCTVSLSLPRPKLSPPGVGTRRGSVAAGSWGGLQAVAPHKGIGWAWFGGCWNGTLISFE